MSDSSYLPLSPGGSMSKGPMSYDNEFLLPKPRRRFLYTACLSLVIVSVVGVLGSTLWTMTLPTARLTAEPTTQAPVQDQDPMDSLHYLRGPPTDKFRGQQEQFGTIVKLTENSL